MLYKFVSDAYIMSEIPQGGGQPVHVRGDRNMGQDAIVSDYRRRVQLCAQEHADTDIPNTSTEHARIVLEYLFRNADSRVRILTTKFYYNFWIQLVSEISSFLSKETNAKLEIIVLRPKQMRKDLIEILSRKFTGRFEVKALSPTRFRASFPSIQLDEIPNFTVIEPVGYRFELSDAEMDKSIVKAFANFGNKQVTTELDNTFGSLWTKATEDLQLGTV
jgi:hypothetical protein